MHTPIRPPMGMSRSRLTNAVPVSPRGRPAADRPAAADRPYSWPAGWTPALRSSFPNSSSAPTRPAATDRGPDDQPCLLADARGRWLAVWRSEDDLDGRIGTDGDILCAQSADAGATWSPPMPLNSDAPDDFLRDNRPRILADPAGGW